MVQAAEKLRPITRAEYDRMVELGFFRNERVELWRGQIVQMSPQHSPHASAVYRIGKMLLSLLDLPGRATVRSQLPLALSDFSEPEPDVAVVSAGDYSDAHPNTALLLIEVADSSLADDRAKAEDYAAAGVPEYWIVNLVDGLVEVHTNPMGRRYGSVIAHGPGQDLRPRSFPDLVLRTDEVLGRSTRT
jgi:Uma2 family endonuclease